MIIFNIICYAQFKNPLNYGSMSAILEVKLQLIITRGVTIG